MSESIAAPTHFKIYILIKQNGMYFSNIGADTPSLGLGFFNTIDAAEKSRTMEILKLPADSKEKFLIFDIDVPNPTYQKNS